MAITVKFFAVLREQTGKSEQVLEFEEGMAIPDAWKKTMGGTAMPDNLLVAVNMNYTRLETSLNDGDEIAFFPAVTGG